MSSTAVTDNFVNIPTRCSSPDTRAVFIRQLHLALIDMIGFLYLVHAPVPDALFDQLIAYPPRIFEPPQECMDALRMANSPSGSIFEFRSLLPSALSTWFSIYHLSCS